MKSIKEIMNELGWEDGKTSGAAEAFIKNLIQASGASSRPLPLKQRPDVSPAPKKQLPAQLSFDFEKASGDE